MEERGKTRGVTHVGVLLGGQSSGRLEHGELHEALQSAVEHTRARATAT